MGYYVHTTENVEFFLPKENIDKVYQKMCELNDFDDLKRGGMYGSNNDPVEGERYRRDKWFSWMSPNYPETCKNMFEILQELGFYWNLDEEGNVINIGYDYNKTGNEEYFLCCFAGFVADGSEIEFKGEDESYWKFVFKNGKMTRYDGEVEIKYYLKNSEEYEFGKPTNADVQSEIWRKNFYEDLKKNKDLESKVIGEL